MRGLHWFRDDLRLTNNPALQGLFEQVDEWAAVFVVEPRLISRDKTPDKRTRFLLDCLDSLRGDLSAQGVSLIIVKGPAETEIPRLMGELSASILSFNTGVSPFAKTRDERVRRAVEKASGRVIPCQDNVIFSAQDIRTKNGSAYTVYTPYRKSWWKRYAQNEPAQVPTGQFPRPIRNIVFDDATRLLQPDRKAAMTPRPAGGERVAQDRLGAFLEGPVAAYALDRDRPDRDGTSRLSAHLRFGTVSVRECFSKGLTAGRDDPARTEGAGRWLDELVWREFYSAILEEHPRVLRENYRPEYETLAWRNDTREFEAWCEGRTGFPIVDAGIRQLRATGWMHNRVRMITASFLTKDLLIDWRLGEQFFFEHLVDGDPASNNGGWQWAASTGTDAQPFFRIFNPWRQAQRWDPEGDYVRRWVTELQDLPADRIHGPHCGPSFRGDYPPPMIDHAVRGKEALQAYRHARELGRKKQTP